MSFQKKSLAALLTIVLVIVNTLQVKAQCSLSNIIVASAIAPTSNNGTTTNIDGTIVLTGFQIGQRFQVSEGSSFSVMAATGAIRPIPANGVIETALPNPNMAKEYTVRIYDDVNDGCFNDATAKLYPTLLGVMNAGETYTLRALDTLNDVQWFLDGAPIAGGNTNPYIASAQGRYTYIGKTPSGCTMHSCSALELRGGAALPVKMLYFLGASNYCQVRLNWATATELNAKTFEVWRSCDGINFTKIGEVAAAGTTNSAQYYDFIDTKPSAKNYYRLVEIDFDGTTQVVNMANIVTTQGCDIDEANGISSIFPNPNNTDNVNVRFFTDRQAEEIELVIYDVLGREMLATPARIETGTNLLKLDISLLASGTYFVKARGNGWYSLSQKFVRTR
jgi:Secretion system C-terminal sorting domain